MDPTLKTRRTVLICLLLTAVTLLTYWPQTGHDFITYDDTFYLTQNAHVQQGLTWPNVAWAFRTGETGNWHPLTWLSHMLDVQLFGMKPGWHHLTSLLFHAANGVLLFLLLQRMTGAPPDTAPGARASSPLWAPLDHLRALMNIGRPKRTGCPRSDPSVVTAGAPPDTASGARASSPLWAPFDHLRTLMNIGRPKRTGCPRAGASIVTAGAVWRSALVAALFALHPLHVQSVAWAAERKDVLSGFFFMLTLLAYVRFAEVLSLKSKVQSQEVEVRRQEMGDRGLNAESGFTHHASLFYLLSLFLFALGLMSKPMLVTLPFVLLLLDYWPLRRLELKTPDSRLQTLLPLLLEKLPFFALSAASCVVTFWAQRGGGAVVSMAALAFPQRVANAIVAYATYLEKTFWPAHLAVLYPFEGDIPTVTVIFSGALLLGITLWAVVPPLLLWRRGLGRGGPFTHLPRWIAWTQSSTGSDREPSRLAATKMTGRHQQVQHPSPFSSAASRDGSRSGPSLLPSVVAPASCACPHLVVGWFWFLGMLVPVIGLVQVGMQRMADRYTYLPLIGVFVMVAWGMPERLGQWRLSRRVLAVAARLVLAACVAATSRELSHWQDSEHVFGRALEVAPANYVALDNYGRALLKQRKLAEAIQSFSAAVALQPDLDASRCGLGSALLEQGKYEEAADQFTRVLELQPDHEIALLQLGIVRGRQGRLTEAAAVFARVLRLHPEDAGAHNNLGNVLAQQGKHEEAVRQFEEAVRLKPDHAGAQNNLAISCKKLGRIGEAIAHYREAIRLQPDSLEALNNLAWLLAAEPDAQYRNGAEAVQLATRACELTRYQNPVPLTTLAAAYAETGQFQTAVSFAEQAQELTRGGQGALAVRLSAMLKAFRAGQPYHGE